MTPDAGRLPVEVLSMIADCVEIHHLLALSHVCARWYAVARAHPTFWRDIRLAAVSNTAVEFFQARMDASGGRSVNLYLQISGYPLNEGIKNVVIPAVTRSLCRVVQLSLDMHSTTASHVLSSMLEPAPLLENLSLRFFYHWKGQLAATLPPNLLARSCPRLADLSLMNVMLPAEPILAFRGVHSMMFHFRRQRVIPARTFDQFPVLRSLVIKGDARLRVESSNGRVASLNVPPLEKLELWLTRCDYDLILSSFPNIASARHIVCCQPREHVAEQLIGHLVDGHLELSFLCLRDDMVHIVLHELPTNHMRSLVESARCIIDDMPRGVLFAPSRLERYETLRIFAQLGYLAPHIEALPRCRTLELVLDFNAELPLQSIDIGGPLRLPELRTIVVTNGRQCLTRGIGSSPILSTVDAELLGKYLSQLLGAHPDRPSLRLDGVSVTGNRVELFRLFACVLS